MYVCECMYVCLGCVCARLMWLPSLFHYSSLAQPLSISMVSAVCKLEIILIVFPSLCSQEDHVSSRPVKQLVQCQVQGAHSIMADFRNANLTPESGDHPDLHFCDLFADIFNRGDHPQANFAFMSHL